MKNLRNAISIAVILALNTITALAQPIIAGPNTTVATTGQQSDGQVNIITQNAGPIRFHTNNVLRGYIDGSTGKLTGFSYGASTFDSLTVTGLTTTGTLASGAATFSSTVGVTGISTLGDDISFSDSAPIIKTTTVDGSDNRDVVVTAASASGSSRSGSVVVAGNESSNTGSVFIQAGLVTGGVIYLDVGGSNRFNIAQDGSLNQNGTNGGSIFLPRAGTGILVGASSVASGLPGIGGFLSVTDPASYVSYQAVGTGNASTGPTMRYNKTRASTGVPTTVVQSGDELGNIVFQGADGTVYRNAASVTAVVDGTPGSGDMPGRLEFNTVTDGAATTLRRFYITNAGDLTGDTTNGGDIIVSRTGKTISIQEATAASACMGVATPNGVTNVTVTTSCAVSGARVFYSRVGAITNMAAVSTTTAPNGSSFTFASAGAADTLASSVVYLIVKESA